METNFKLPDENVSQSQDGTVEDKGQDKGSHSAEANTTQAKLSFGAFSRLARILIDIAQNPAPVQEQQNANPNEQ